VSNTGAAGDIPILLPEGVHRFGIGASVSAQGVPSSRVLSDLSDLYPYRPSPYPRDPRAMSGFGGMSALEGLVGPGGKLDRYIQF
jgi:hypothetical protein